MEKKQTLEISDDQFNNTKRTIKYNEEVNQYIKTNVDDKEYGKMIEESPQELFASIDALKLAQIQINLFNNTPPSGYGNNEKILEVELNHPDQQVIKNDCHRTRVREAELLPDFEKTLEKILTYYCFIKKIPYKQGLNEIFGPLLLLKYKIPDLKLNKIFNIGEVFIDKFCPNYFYEKEFYSLKSALGLYKILLRYHEPSVFNRLDQYNIVPEMYATNWMMTFLSAKIGLNLLYDYWSEIIKTQDPLIMHFILVSFIKMKREMIINCDTNLLAPLMTSLSLKKKEEINQIFKLAFELRQQTPFSFRILANKLGFLKTKNTIVKEMYELYHPQLIPAMPIFPLELLSLTYQSGIKCIDPDCKNGNNKALKILEDEFCVIKKNDSNISILKFHNALEENHICEKCDMKIQKKIKYITLDLRIKNDESDKTWVLPGVVDVEKKELLSPDFSKVITDRFFPERGLYHFIFLTSNTKFFYDFENKLYVDNTSENDKFMIKYGMLEQTKVNKELNLEEVKNLTDKEKYSIKEYDNMRKTLNAMQKENFPYVGFVFGGWEEIHEESFLQNIELVNHDKEKCELCLEKRNKKKKKEKEKEKEKNKNDLANELWKSQITIKLNELNKIVSNNKNNFLCLCTLGEYKGKSVNYDISIVLLDELFIIQIYKFEQRKHYDDFIYEIDKDYFKQIEKNKDYYDLGKEDKEDTELILIEEIKIFQILGMKADSKNKNILNINYKENVTDKKSSKKKEKNKEQILKIDFPTNKESKNFVDAFKNLTNIYKAQIKKK